MDKEKKRRKSYCSVSTCLKNSNTDPDLSYFRLPNDANRTAIWLKNIKQENTKIKKILVCETHFEDDYINTNGSRKRLLCSAVPTLNLPGEVSYDCTPSIEFSDCDNSMTNQTNEAFDDEDITPATVDDMDIKPVIEVYDDFAIIHLTQEDIQGHKLNIKSEPEEEIQCKKRKVESTEDTEPMILGNGSVSEDSSESMISKMKQLCSALRKKKEGEVYTDNFKYFALKLYFNCPKTYRILKKTLPLPSISMLYRLCIPTTTESDDAIRTLHLRVRDMTESQKQCAICIGAMPLKEHLFYNKSKDRIIGFHEVEGVQRLDPAKFLLVVMVRGLFDDWKHVISYSFLALYQNYKDKTIDLDNIITKMFHIGLKVRVLITDMESEVMSAAVEKNISPNCPYFFVNNRKIYYMYDPPHIIRAIRDSLMDKDFHIGDTVVKWQYISELYKIDMGRHIQLAPKLTSSHMKPKEHEKGTVSLASQVFSRTTAAGISALIDMNLIDESAKHTAEFISKFNRIFDLLNFSKFVGKSTLFKGEKSQIVFLRKTMSFISEIRVIGCEHGNDHTKRSKFIRCYQITINAIISLYEHFKIEDRKSLRPWFTRDCLDIFFERLTGKNTSFPTCHSITTLIKNIPIFSIFQWVLRSKDDNLDTFLDLANKITTTIEIYKQSKLHTASESQGEIKTAGDFSDVKLPKKFPLKYVASYMLCESYQLHSDCKLLRDYIFKSRAIDVSGNISVDYKNPMDTVDIVLVPPDFMRFIQLLEAVITSHFDFEYYTVSNPIVSALINAVQDVEFAAPCDCFPLKAIKELYVRFRFYLLFNYNNRVYKNSRKYRKSFSLNVNFEV